MIDREYDLPVDSEGKATTIALHKFNRPHMRAFHFSWLSFFLAFFGWFAIPPMLTTIRVSLDLCANGNFETLGPDAVNLCDCDGACRAKIAEQNGVAVAGTILMRLLVGGWAETYGPRFSQAFMLIFFCIPLALSGLVQDMEALTAVRFFIGGMGATFVITQFWTSVMFSKNVVGTANATSAGWGNLGGGAANALMPALLLAFELNIPRNTAWRVVPVVPAATLVLVGICLYLFADDVPQGTYKALYESGERQRQNGLGIFIKAAKDLRVWLLFLIYGGCFGTELVMNGQLATYFKDYYGTSREVAGLTASLFGLMNLFARSLGGIVSDLANKYFGHRGRHWVFFVAQFLEGIMMILFSLVPAARFGLGVFVLICFSTCVQMAEGAQYAVVPYVGQYLKALGPVSGIVGAGGNMGAVLWSFAIHRQLAGQADLTLPFRVHGAAVIGTALLIPFVHYPSLGSMFLRKTDYSAPNEGVVKASQIEVRASAGAENGEGGAPPASAANSNPTPA